MGCAHSKIGEVIMSNEEATLTGHADLTDVKSAWEGHLEAMQFAVVEEKQKKKVFLKSKIVEMRNFIADRKRNAQVVLNIFPVETWTKIFGFLEDPADLVSCSNTCIAFENILNDTKQQWLFGKVFPFVIRYLDRGEFVKCRLVCKMWLSNVDNVLENGRIIAGAVSPVIWPQEHSLGYELTGFESYHRFKSDFKNLFREFYLPTMNMLYDRAFRRELYAQHLKNPFVGSILALKTVHGHKLGPRFLTELESVITPFGKYVKHCKMSDDGDYPNFWNFLHGVVYVLENCPKLRSLSLKYWTVCVENSTEIFPEHQNLESMMVSVRGKGDFTAITRMIEQYSNQLKYLALVEPPFERFHVTKWDNLKELCLQTPLTEELINSLMGMSAPNLYKLEIKADHSSPKDINVAEIVQNFSKLNHLVLGLPELVSVTHSPTICCASIKTLEVSCVEPSVCFDFLINYPFLKRLIIKHSSPMQLAYMTFDMKEDDESYPPMEYDFDSEEEEFYTNKWLGPEDNLVQISKLLWEDSFCKRGDPNKPMYKSNVWEILEYLEFLEIGCLYQRPFKRIWKVFTRLGYERCASQN